MKGQKEQHHNLQREEQNNNTVQKDRSRKNKRSKHYGQEEMLQVLSNCEGIIKQQQQYIGKLQNDNQRKQLIIANLLLRKQKINFNTSQQIHLEKQITSENVYNLQQKLKQIHQKYEQTLLQKQKMQNQMQIKDNYVKQLSEIVRNQKIRQSQHKQQILQWKKMATQLKEAYQTKISLLLAQIRKKVQQDIQKSKQKSSLLQLNQHQSVSRLKGQLNFTHNQLQTPIKYKINNNKQQEIQNNQKNSSSREKTVRNIRKNWPQNLYDPNIIMNRDRKRLINTPYKESNSLIIASHKIFLAQSEINTKKKQKLDIQQKKLRQIDDVQFMNDSQQKQFQYEDISDKKIDFQDYDSIYTDKKEKVKKSKENTQGKISIQNIIKQFNQYCEKQNQNQLVKELVIQTHQKRIDQTQNENAKKKMKVQQILDKLSFKIKKFQDQNIYDV